MTGAIVGVYLLVGILFALYHADEIEESCSLAGGIDCTDHFVCLAIVVLLWLPIWIELRFEE